LISTGLASWDNHLVDIWRQQQFFLNLTFSKWLWLNVRPMIRHFITTNHHWVERYACFLERKDTLTKTQSILDFPSNNQLVNNLKGRLFLVQGDMDQHVPPSISYRLAYDLMMANKRFDMFIIPRADHFWGDNYSYVIRLMEFYFIEHLMGDETFNINMF